MKIKTPLVILFFCMVLTNFAYATESETAPEIPVADESAQVSDEIPAEIPSQPVAEPQPVSLLAEAGPLDLSKLEGGAVHTVEAGDTLYEIAQKYKTTVELLKKSNGLKSDLIHPGMKLKINTTTISIQVDKSDNVLTLLVDEKPLKQYRVATGTNNGTPVGEFKIINKLENPTWFKAGAIVPPDSPENILGTRWLGFDHPGYGIHGTTIPESIGHQATSGCVRMLNTEVEELYAVVPVGTKVFITD